VPAPRDNYERRRLHFNAERNREAARSRRVSTARLIAFVALIGAGVWWELRPGSLPLIVAVSLLAGFIALVFLHQRIRRRQSWARLLELLNRAGLRRLERAWDALPPHEATHDLRDHPYGGDLDLFGRPALAQLLGPTGTPAGAATLEAWLLEPADPATVRERQEAIRELAPLNDLRDALAGHASEVAVRRGRRRRPGAPAPLRDAELETFLEWAEEPPLLSSHPLWLWAARLIPLVTVATIAIDLADLAPGRWWLLPLGAAIALTAGPGRTVRATFRRAFGREGLFRGYPELLETIVSAQLRSPALARIRERLSAGGLSAPAQIARLHRLMHLADLFHSGTTYLPVQLLTLWDFHVMERVDAWRRVAGSHVRDWLEATGVAEALCALATLAHDHPEWAYPEIDESADELVAQRLGHPMLPPETRVDNDVTVGPPGTFLLVTGSNMSGKSTLLRAIGMNTVLAFAGAPVCAAGLRMPAVRLHTSIHIEDSLVRGVSFFMAQLHRMRDIVAAADAARASSRRILYLLDEILQGTNSAERRIAATRVIRHLVDSGAIGAVTTHDLELAAEPALVEAARPVHLRETVHAGEGPVMTFDYVLRPGVATSTNALRLMEIVGLGD
jgi:hypothetical protein